MTGLKPIAAVPEDEKSGTMQPKGTRRQDDHEVGLTSEEPVSSASSSLYTKLCKWSSCQIDVTTRKSTRHLPAQARDSDYIAAILRVVKKRGSSRYYALGRQLGFSKDQIDLLCEKTFRTEDRIQILFDEKSSEVGTVKAAAMLWDAFLQIADCPVHQESSEIQKKFFDLANVIDPERSTYWLYQRKTLEKSDVDEVLNSDVGARSGRLLRILEEKGSKGLEALNDVLQQKELMKDGRPDSPDMKYHGSTSRSRKSPKSARQGNLSQVEQPSVVKVLVLPCNVQDTREQFDQGGSIFDKASKRRQSSSETVPLGLSEKASKVVPNELSRSSLDFVNPSCNRLASGSRQGDSLSRPVTSRVPTPSLRIETQEPTSQETLSPLKTVSIHADEKLLTSSLQPTSVLHLKGDPEVHPIFESKYWRVERATDHFNEAPVKQGGRRLGVGSFGTVFQGVLHSETGQKFEVAVKRLKKASSLNPAQVELSRKQFGTEVNVLTRYLHKNIVRLVGFSSDGPELCLIYEFMQKGALSHRLDCKDKSSPLDWRVRLTIARDIASALEFLHTAYRQPVIHRDVKSSNVLLGTDFEAKLYDFGLAMVITSYGELQVESALVGTRPYMPPEAFQEIVSTKTDVYGLGMILFELATGLPPYSSKKKQDLKAYLEDIERQRVDMMKMLDPKAHWPKGKRWEGRDNTFGLELLDVAKLATTRTHTTRPEIAEVLPRLTALAERGKLRDSV